MNSNKNKNKKFKNGPTNYNQKNMNIDTNINLRKGDIQDINNEPLDAFQVQNIKKNVNISKINGPKNNGQHYNIPINKKNEENNRKVVKGMNNFKEINENSKNINEYNEKNRNSYNFSLDIDEHKNGNNDVSRKMNNPISINTKNNINNKKNIKEKNNNKNFNNNNYQKNQINQQNFPNFQNIPHNQNEIFYNDQLIQQKNKFDIHQNKKNIANNKNLKSHKLKSKNKNISKEQYIYDQIMQNDFNDDQNILAQKNNTNINKNNPNLINERDHHYKGKNNYINNKTKEPNYYNIDMNTDFMNDNNIVSRDYEVNNINSNYNNNFNKNNYNNYNNTPIPNNYNNDYTFLNNSNLILGCNDKRNYNQNINNNYNNNINNYNNINYNNNYENNNNYNNINYYNSYNNNNYNSNNYNNYNNINYNNNYNNNHNNNNNGLIPYPPRSDFWGSIDNMKGRKKNISQSQNNDMNSVMENFFGDFFNDNHPQNIPISQSQSGFFQEQPDILFHSFFTPFGIFGSVFNNNYAANFGRSDFFLNSLMQLIQAARKKNAHPPATKEAMDRLKKFPLEKRFCKKKNGKIELPNCCVCLEEIELGKQVVLLPCGHMYHTNCCLEWLKTNNTCPICRFEVK